MEILKKRILSIDFGLERVGIAVTDTLHIAITQLPTLYYNNDNFWYHLSTIILEKQIGTIVIGVPYTDNEEHKMRTPIEAFKTLLSEKLAAENLSIPILFFDETNSSNEAIDTMIQMGMKKKQRSKKENIDSISAAIILKNYLTYKDI